jgi:hypothetical protein
VNIVYELIHLAMAIAASVGAFYSYRAKKQGDKNSKAITEVHLSINSRMDQFLEEARKLATMQGAEAERDKSKNSGEIGG